MADVIDRSYDKETGELTQFTIIDENGEPDIKKANPADVLLYDPEDKLPFDDGMHGFLAGDEALVLSPEDPEVMVAPTNNEYCYILRVRGNTVETTPKDSEDVLAGVRDAAIDGDLTTLVQLYDEIMSTQVRRGVINALLETFEESERIERNNTGWLIDDFYLVDWTASMYVKHDDPDEPDYQRGGGGVVETDRSYEFVQLSLTRDVDPIEVSISGDTFRLTEREMLFLAKVKWLLNRRHYHPDEPFWMYADKRAAVDWKTGEPEQEDEDEPSRDIFNL